jgi:hypothetical protein
MFRRFFQKVVVEGLGSLKYLPKVRLFDGLFLERGRSSTKKQARAIRQKNKLLPAHLPCLSLCQRYTLGEATRIAIFLTKQCAFLELFLKIRRELFS